MAETIWNLDNGVSSDSDGTLNAITFRGSLSVGEGNEQISINGETSTLTVGSEATATFTGAVYMDSLETSDPLEVDKLWNNSGVLNISSGS